MSRSENSILAKGSILALIAGILLACIYGNNDMVSRIAMPALALIPAGIMTIVGVLRGGSWGKSGFTLCCVFIAAGYFIMRAWVSPVSVFAAKDSLLFLQAALVAFVVSVPANRKCLATWFPWILLTVVLTQCIPLPVQWNDHNYVPFRELTHEKRGISGFFGHRNFFAVVVGMCSLGLLSYTLLTTQKSRIHTVSRCVWGGLAALGLTLMFLSESRGAWVAVVCTCILLIAIYLIWRVVSGIGSLRTSLVSGLLIIVFGGIGVGLLAGKITQGRGLDNDGKGFFFANSRDDILRMASNCEPESLLLGGGARFFEYEARRVIEPSLLSNAGLGDPRVVHNEYVEALVNYGYVGMIIFILLIAMCVVLSIWQIFVTGATKVTEEKRRWLAMQMTVLGILVAISIQCVVDFSLHVLPITMLFGLAVGCIQMGFPKKVLEYVNLGFGLLILLGLSIVAFPFWKTHLKYETAKNIEKTHPLRAANLFREVGEVTNDYEAFLHAAQLYLSSSKDRETTRLAEEVYYQVGDANPYFAPSIIELAKLKILRGEYEEALTDLDQAEKLVNKLSIKYGVRYWQAVARYCKTRNELGSGDNTADSLVTVIDIFSTSLKYMTKRFTVSRQEQELVKEAKAFHSLFRARYAADRALAEELGGKFALSFAYVIEAQKYYRLAGNYNKKISSQDEQRLNVLKQQFAVFQVNKVEPDTDLRKKLDSETFTEVR